MFAPDDMEDGTVRSCCFRLIHAADGFDLQLYAGDEADVAAAQSRGAVGGVVKVGDGGFYVLHTDFPDLAGAVAIPNAQPGILAPYQEKPKFYPMELKLHYDPKRDTNHYFPLLMAMETPARPRRRLVLQGSSSG